MSEFPKFDLQHIQLKHPEAFFQRLNYSFFKVTGLSPTTSLLLQSMLAICLYALFCTLLGILLSHFIALSTPTHIIDAGILASIPLIYLFVIFAYYQAKYSAQSLTKRLQYLLYLLLGLSFVLAWNLKFYVSDLINFTCLFILYISMFCILFTEGLFKLDSRAVDRVRLQKIRQLSYWALKQSQKKALDAQQAYYFNQLHLQAMQEEQKLVQRIRYNSVSDFFQSEE
ncbi:hypothetical protein B9T33_13265 [Acinetobacter sp. ANC 5054]|uniref:hypothetical protein n=1 Tax=Acinetobacter sp. ANC 5054 TaxID=1977877 RepID=UPI000A32D8B7|nr:hypothetical protein [Acinetobacter sp. ANC 5054]OTG79155.1 hypothetical protein B9T33_13265 [Acinetobacter sp. ANC 5054]